MKEIELYRLNADEKIVHVPETHSIVVRFNAPKKVLSTSLLNGGYREDIKGLFNYTCCGLGSCMSLEKYEEHLGKCAAVVGLDPAHSTGIGTAALMENAAIVEETYEELKVAACVTAGVEGMQGAQEIRRDITEQGRDRKCTSWEPLISCFLSMPTCRRGY